jgi:hypothetical protein
MRLRLIGTMLVAAIALSAAATASAATFETNTPGGKGRLTGIGNQELEYTGHKVVCKKMTGTANPSGAALFVSITFLVTYSGCEAFGSPVTILTGELLFNANGSVRIGNTDKFVITSAAGKCSIAILSENESTVKLFGTVKYANEPGGSVKGQTGAAGVSGIPTVVHGAVGSVCGEPGETTGVYKGEAITEVEGGKISVEQ